VQPALVAAALALQQAYEGNRQLGRPGIMLRDSLVVLYLLALSGLALYGLLGLFTLWLFWRHRGQGDPQLDYDPADLPFLTVQLPLYNERYVVKRLIGATARLHYPRERLQIQVLDDSTDDTTERAAALVDHYRRQGLDITLLHRNERSGYKAGALAGALTMARGEFIAIFDADFQPEPDFLLQTVPFFLRQPRLGVVQTRWGHLNADHSLLTAAQALALDKHFVVEQTVRFRANLFPKFNGTAGIWRRACLEQSGGWQDDTVCEDLCLSTRAVLQGWQFHFLPHVVAPAELPSLASAYKSQQARWAQGSTQCLLKHGRAILTSRRHSKTARLYALLTMSSYTTSFLLLLLLLLQLPILYFDIRLSSWLAAFAIAGIGQPLLFVIAQQQTYRDWRRRVRYLPALLLTGIGLSVTLSRAVLQAFVTRRQNFVRTPKWGRAGPARGYRLPLDPGVVVELLLAGYAAVALWLAVERHNYGPVLFLLSCLAGFTYISLQCLREQRL
jgi:cellulose synthase/poly-beta-1,6-N-acetylglucosamine synthase-like glycosyltransferase